MSDPSKPPRKYTINPNVSHNNWFKPGNKAAQGYGRPPRARELAALKILSEEVGLEGWRAIVARAKLDALGLRKSVRKVKGKKGESVETLVVDKNSTPRSRGEAREWLGNYLMGKPDQHLFAHREDGSEESGADLQSQLAAMTMDEMWEQIKGIELNAASLPQLTEIATGGNGNGRT